METSLAYDEVHKVCNIGAIGCDGSYDMVRRANEVEKLRDSFKELPRYDACDNPKCQDFTARRKKRGGSSKSDS